MLTYNQRAAEIMLHLVTHPSHGYSQPGRAGNGTIETVRLSDGTQTTVHGGDYDCSEAIRMCYVAAGVLPRGSYMWTGNEHELLTSHGFVQISPVDARVGDVLWRSGHTEMVIMVAGELKQAGFRISEHGTISGAVGDQTGHESMYSALLPHRWSRAYRYVGNQPAGSNVRPTKPIATTKPAHKVAVDGYIGRSSVSEMQHQLGTPIDGVISGQYAGNKKYLQRLTSINWGGSGSTMVKHLQRGLNRYGKYRLAEDGVLGPASVVALQKWLRSYCGYKKHAIDGYLGRDTAYNIQNALNANKFTALR